MNKSLREDSKSARSWTVTMLLFFLKSRGIAKFWLVRWRILFFRKGNIRGKLPNAERTSNGITNAVHLNSYDTIKMLDFIIKEKIPTTNDLIKQREELTKAIWATTNYKATRGIIFADGKTGYLRRNYNRIAILTNGVVTIQSP